MDDNKSKQAAPVDSDILQGKADVRRAVKAVETSASQKPVSPHAKPKEVQPSDVPAQPTAEKTPAPQPQQAAQPVGESKATIATATQEKSGGETPAVPRFNLAEKILAEQRRFASERRHRTHSSDEAGGKYAANDTVGAVIKEVKDNMTRPATGAVQTDRTAGADGLSLNATGKRLIADIVARDIAALCSGRRSSPGRN